MTDRYDRPIHSHLYTNLSAQQADAATLYTRYNERQCIEALMKSAKAGLSIDHLRTRRYHPIANFLHLATLTFNPLSWFRHYILTQVGLEGLGLCELTHTLMDIPAKCAREHNHLHLKFPSRHPLAPVLAQL